MKNTPLHIHALSVVAFVLVTFVVQALNHFVVNSAHYATQSIMAPEPVIIGGIVAMIIQGAILTMLYAQTTTRFAGVGGAVRFSLIMGLFLVVYIALTEPSKYIVIDPLHWFMVEAIVGFIQFAFFGVVLGLLHRRVHGVQTIVS